MSHGAHAKYRLNWFGMPMLTRPMTAKSRLWSK